MTNFFRYIINVTVLTAKFGGRIDSNNRVGNPVAKPGEGIAGNTNSRTRRPEGINLEMLRRSEKNEKEATYVNRDRSMGGPLVASFAEGHSLDRGETDTIGRKVSPMGRALGRNKSVLRSSAEARRWQRTARRSNRGS